MYIRLFYALSAIILISLVVAAWLAIVLKKDDSTEGGWVGRLVASDGGLQGTQEVRFQLLISPLIVFATCQPLQDHFLHPNAVLPPLLAGLDHHSGLLGFL